MTQEEIENFNLEQYGVLTEYNTQPFNFNIRGALEYCKMNGYEAPADLPKEIWNTFLKD